MAKIVFIGAGSLNFTRALIRDLMTFPLLRNGEIALVDINEERLDFAMRAAQAIMDQGGYPASLTAHTDRSRALKDADAVCCTILCGEVDLWKYDITIPKSFGVDINVGDTRGPAGIFRALRTIPTMLDICRDMERYCPQAILLNYTNPMAMLCRAMQRVSSIQVTGLCHSVQGTAAMLAEWIGAPIEEVDYLCAGINHQAWYLEFNHNGEDAYPRLHQAMKRKKIYNAELVRNEMFLHLGYYVTESSGHNSEYNWWFRKRPDLIEKYCTHSSNWNPGVYAYILKEYQRVEKTWRQEVHQWFADGAPMSLERGGEYAAHIINAYVGGTPFLFNGNVANTGLITNLPEAACVEVPVLINRRGFNPIHVGSLPPQCAALNQISVASEEMAVEAALTGDAEGVYHAVCYDPLTAAVLSLAEIKQLVNKLFKKNAPYLPQFERFSF
ncbi:MAG: alpha-galactosidase [Candidatus Hydrogenedentes bacterium]|nr:alpha-galactosidase [Candidatus Hydrogenedentota bacterium]